MGGGESVKKISWVKWDTLCCDIGEGGVGLKDLESFNRALVGKWLWRFLLDRNSLWAKVIRSCCGDIERVSGGFKCCSRGGRGGWWWRKVVGLSSGSKGTWMRDNLVLDLKEGSGVSFWHQVWVGDDPLKSSFPRLFHLSNKQDGKISDMGVWIDGKWEWNLGWRRSLFDRDIEMVGILTSIINSVVLTAGARDGWRWRAAPDGVFSVKSAYREMRKEVRPISDVSSDDKLLKVIWKAAAPFKAITTAWRALKNRIPTCDNLSKRGVEIEANEAKCSACKSSPESLSHLLIRCEKSTGIWDHIHRWIGVQAVYPQSIKDQWISFVNLGCKTKRKLLISLWICIIGTIWKWRNDCRFNGMTWDCDEIVSEIKARMWSWRLVFNLPAVHSNFQSWFSSISIV